MTHASEPTTLLAAADEAGGAGDFQSAERLLREALAMQEGRLGRLHPDLVETLNNLAVACERQQKTAEAERGYRRAHAIAVASLNPGNPVIAASLKNLVEFCEAHGVPLWTPPAQAATASPSPLPEPAERAASGQVTPVADVESDPVGRTGAARPPRWLAAALVFGVGLIAVLWFVAPWRPSSSQASALGEPAAEPPRASAPPEVPVERSVSPDEGSARTRAAPAEAVRPPAAPATQALRVLAAIVCTDFDRRGSPDWHCTPIGGPAPPGAFTFYTRLQSPEASTVEHRWYQGDSLHMRVSLRVGASNSGGYRTYSRATIGRERSGDWRVEVRASDGALLQEERFSVR